MGVEVSDPPPSLPPQKRKSCLETVSPTTPAGDRNYDKIPPPPTAVRQGDSAVSLVADGSIFLPFSKMNDTPPLTSPGGTGDGVKNTVLGEVEIAFFLVHPLPPSTTMREVSFLSVVVVEDNFALSVPPQQGRGFLPFPTDLSVSCDQSRITLLLMA